jgi:hypothetical protein
MGKRVELHDNDYEMIYYFYTDIRKQLEKEYPVLINSKKQILKNYVVFTNALGDIKVLRRHTIDHYKFYMLQRTLQKNGEAYYSCLGTLGSLLRTMPPIDSKRWFESWYGSTIETAIRSSVPSYKRMHHYCKLNKRVCTWGESYKNKECYCETMLGYQESFV